MKLNSIADYVLRAGRARYVTERPKSAPADPKTVAYYVEREMADLRERNALLAEIERLRAALREIARLNYTNHNWAPGMATRALGGKYEHAGIV